MAHIYQEAYELLKRGEDIVLATIIDRSGSAPRAAGAKMVVRKDGSIRGTIGGGLLEAQVIQTCHKSLEDGLAKISSFHFDAKSASDAGMICGGSIRVLVQPVMADDLVKKELFREYSQLLTSGEKAIHITWFQEGSELEIHESLIKEDLPREVDHLCKELGISREVLVGVKENFHLLIHGTTTIIFQRISRADTVLIFGGGHIGKMLARLTGWIGFRTIVIDDRDDFANKQNFPDADAILVRHAVEDTLKEQSIDTDTYIVIVTRGHLDDQKVLEAALRTKAGYIGMIGSRRKLALIYKELLEKGFTNKDIERIHAPIGIEIGAETPEEIAISIMAELIQTRVKIQGK